MAAYPENLDAEAAEIIAERAEEGLGSCKRGGRHHRSGSARSALFSETSALNLKSDEGAYRAGALEQEALYRAPPMTDVSDEYRLKKLRFRAWRRGFREIDLILGRFTDAHGDAFTPEEFEAFEALLQAQDQDACVDGQSKATDEREKDWQHNA